MRVRCRLLGHGMTHIPPKEILAEYERSGRTPLVKCPHCNTFLYTPPRRPIDWLLVIALATAVILGWVWHIWMGV